MCQDRDTSTILHWCITMARQERFPSPSAAREDLPAGRPRSLQGETTTSLSPLIRESMRSPWICRMPSPGTIMPTFMCQIWRRRKCSTWARRDRPWQLCVPCPMCRSKPPVNSADFDLVVVARNASLDGKLNRYIDGGGRVIFIASDQESPEYLPVRVTGEHDRSRRASGCETLGFAEGVHFDEIGLFGYPEAVSRRGSTTMVEANGVPILSYWRLGKGHGDLQRPGDGFGFLSASGISHLLVPDGELDHRSARH